MRKIISTVMSFAIIASLAAGCGSNEKAGNTAGQTASSVAASTSANQKVNEYGWAVPEKTLEITAYQADKSNPDTVAKNIELMNQYLLERFNEANFLPLFYGIVPGDEKLDISLRSAAALIDRALNVEGMSYIPEIYYRYGMKNEAWKVLMELIDPGLPRREYPEVSFAVVSTYVMGLMGINAEGGNTVSTVSNLNNGVEWAEIRDMPIFNNEIAVRHTGNEITEFENRSGKSLIWKAAFNGKREHLMNNGQKTAAQSDLGLDGRPVSFLTLEVQPGKKHLVSV